MEDRSKGETFGYRSVVNRIVNTDAVCYISNIDASMDLSSNSDSLTFKPHNCI